MGKAVRLDKYLADAGIGTRSEVKKLIQKGQIRVDGNVCKHPETKVTPGETEVSYLEEPVKAAQECVYYLLHKPAGCVSATEDPREKTVMDFISSKRRGLFPVGRLDKDTEGLLLITDDGLLAHCLLSPKKHVDKTYYAKVDGIVTEEDIASMKRGVDIGEEKVTLPAVLEILDTDPGNGTSEIRLTIREGKYHQVKRMMEAVGKKVTYLRRISMGPLSLPSDLAPGQSRPLTEAELLALKELTGR
ncbi:MAG: rRNA pseudouridine synthase [Blautia sp.]|nr:rRNA pseudouridine synthase [Blautia sp.]